MNTSSQSKVSIAILARDEANLVGGLVSKIKRSLSRYHLKNPEIAIE